LRVKITIDTVNKEIGGLHFIVVEMGKKGFGIGKLGRQIDYKRTDSHLVLHFGFHFQFLSFNVEQIGREK